MVRRNNAESLDGEADVGTTLGLDSPRELFDGSRQSGPKNRRHATIPTAFSYRKHMHDLLTRQINLES